MHQSTTNRFVDTEFEQNLTSSAEEITAHWWRACPKPLFQYHGCRKPLLPWKVFESIFTTFTWNKKKVKISNFSQFSGNELSRITSLFVDCLAMLTYRKWWICCGVNIKPAEKNGSKYDSCKCGKLSYYVIFFTIM